MKSHKEYKNEYQHWLDEIQALNKAVQHDAEKMENCRLFFRSVCESNHSVVHFLRLTLSVR